MSVSVENVVRWLEWPETESYRIQELADLGPPPIPFEIPTGDALIDVLERLRVPPQGYADIVANVPTPESQPEGYWLLERFFHAVVDARPDALGPPWAAPVITDDAFTHFFHLYVFLAAVPHLRAVHAARGIDEQVTWDTLFDVGLQVANYEVRTGRPGFDGAFWVWQHFRAESFTVGRLQYEKIVLDFDADDRAGFRCGDAAVGVHIPALGPLSPEECDASLARARTFFADIDAHAGVCFSWLLDPQLIELLPASSNIVAFQQRFTISDEPRRLADSDVVRFVFGHLPADLGTLPRDTAVARAVLEHLDGGGHWYFRRGWTPLEPSSDAVDAGAQAW